MFAAAPVATVIFFVTLGFSLYGLFYDGRIVEKLMLRPYEFVHQRKWYQVLTSGFVHADLAHLAFNMLSFYFFAFTLEWVLGSAAFAVVYLASIVLSDIQTIVDHSHDPNYASLGASGGVVAVLFSYILFDPSTKIYLFFLPIGIPAVLYAVLYLLYSYYSSKYQRDNINHNAHLWGAISGIILTLLVSPYIREEFFEGVRHVFR